MNNYYNENFIDNFIIYTMLTRYENWNKLKKAHKFFRAREKKIEIVMADDISGYKSWNNIKTNRILTILIIIKICLFLQC